MERSGHALARDAGQRLVPADEDPDLRHVRTRYKKEFSVAFRTALDALSPE